ncbi:MAG: hypothetical protein A2W98_11825 [Bacteroidetes bacterium GWF2_33_38]|nr:MAG: hypothetical protein A2W98_11825 [Bacteroidetes bacterium GWF2_33_38]OFY76460.1 MAG: hypothetical protein A2265_06965 [Bacteroidetes bacterium RIFOXYA12_FULL_33_9]OFY85135.1 MAG: hypothetical protein A2236_12225 [Bacteroidetes bacterium RIFOXYA2_FULL_33_7]
MKSIKKHIINLAVEKSVDLIGISSSVPDYKLCWQLNQDFNFEFKRISDLVLYNDKKNDTQTFSLYKYSIDDILVIFLGNKIEKGFFFDELKMIDYFIILYNNQNKTISVDELKENLKKTSGINGVFKIDAKSLKAKSKLNFEIPE